MVTEFTTPETAPEPPLPTSPSLVLGWLILAAAALTSIVIIRRMRLFRLTADRTAANPSTHWLILGLAGILILLASQLGALSALALHAGGTGTSVPTRHALAAAGGAAGVLLALAWLRIVRPGTLRDAGVSFRPRDTLKGLGALLLVIPLVIAAGALTRLITEALAGTVAPDRVLHDTLDLLTTGPRDAAWWTIVLLVVTTTPLYEEVLFRGCLQTMLLRRLRSPRFAIIATAAIFTLIHLPVLEPAGLPGLFILALGFGIAMERTGSLTAPVTMHALFNAANITLAMRT